ncbi:hypothetical protein V6R86_13100 [Sphingomonas kaistensis]|uniref:C2H2-type domain-containing protein n=1 Tax=Sphingomonas kaistensis TaxID=298708 RepID=A0ABZ2G6B0_9SPHN
MNAMDQLREALREQERSGGYRCGEYYCTAGCGLVEHTFRDHAEVCPEAAAILAEVEKPMAHLTHKVTLRRQLVKSERNALAMKHYPRTELADYWWPGMVEWLNNPGNVSDYALKGDMDERNDGTGMLNAWFDLHAYFPDVETAALFKLRWF